MIEPPAIQRNVSDGRRAVYSSIGRARPPSLWSTTSEPVDCRRDMAISFQRLWSKQVATKQPRGILPKRSTDVNASPFCPVSKRDGRDGATGVPEIGRDALPRPVWAR